MNITKRGVLSCGCRFEREGDDDVVVEVKKGCPIHDRPIKVTS